MPVGCGKRADSSVEAANVVYELQRQYTGATANTLNIVVPGGQDERFEFLVHSPGVSTTVAQDTLLPLTSQEVTFAYTREGAYSADFKIQGVNGTPYVFEILTWEFSTEAPDPPIISFARPATRSLLNNLLVSDSRVSNTNEIWVQGDVRPSGRAEDGGSWTDLPLDTRSVPVTLTPGDGLKVVNAKFGNIYGNASALGAPAEIFLKQNPPTDCEAEAQSLVVGTNRLTLKLFAKDAFQTFYTVFGDVEAVVDSRAFADGQAVSVFLEPTPGEKKIVLSIQDIAGNSCLEKEIIVTLDPSYGSEGITIEGGDYWTDSENVVADVYFDHFSAQEPLQIMLTGDVSGANANTWMPYEQNIPLVLSPISSGSRRIFAQYKDANGVESYLIAKRIYLKPSIVLEDAGAPFKNVVVSNIQDATSLSITGCNERYESVAYQAAYLCEPRAASVDVTYHFPNGSTLTKSVPP